MKAFEYATPKTKEQAVGLLGQNWGDAELLAGGTDLLALMKDDVVAPKRLVNVKSIAGLDAVSYNARTGLRIGALVRIADFADNADVRKHYPTLARVADDAASPQIRNQATLGGNLCQRPRCWYFRNGYGLLAKDPQSGKSLVVEGDNRYHAILGNDGPAYFVSPSSIAPALIAAGAKVRIFGPNGARELPLEKFFVIPKSDGEREHDLRPNEIMTEIVVPPPSDERFGHYEVRQKAEFDWPLATASVALKMSGNKVQEARIVMGHVAPIPWVCDKYVAATLLGQAVTETTADAAGVVAAEKEGKSLGKNGYKIRLAHVAVKRAILQAAKGA
ncbi:MAG: xanthine dehydrogenase family protein subunit M [Acidobacteriia bacterium]|nr:xanthine dehydrogenase family protein subunit M [Terriglobia bacterium]